MNQTDNSHNDDETIEQYLCNSNDENEIHDNLKINEKLKFNNNNNLDNLKKIPTNEDLEKIPTNEDLEKILDEAFESFQFNKNNNSF